MAENVWSEINSDFGALKNQTLRLKKVESELVTQSCSTLWPRDYSPPCSSAHGILQARVLEWVATFFSRGSSQPRDWAQVSCIAGRFFTVWDTHNLFFNHLITKQQIKILLLRVTVTSNISTMLFISQIFKHFSIAK